MSYYTAAAVGAGPLDTDARALAVAGGYIVTNYQHVYILHPSAFNAPGGAGVLNYGGLGSVGGSSIWQNGDMSFRVLAHEAGHNFGLFHANQWNPTNNLPLGDATALNTLPSAYGTATTGLSIEYGDRNDMLGDGPDSRHWLNPWFASYLSWIPDAAEPGAAESGVYRIYRYDHQDAKTNHTFAVKVYRDGIKDYWLAYRRQFAGDPAYTIGNGAYIFFGYHSYRQNDWIKMDPTNVALLPGQTLNDTNVGIAFTTMAQGGSGADEYIDVSVQLTPEIEWASTNISADVTAGNVGLVLSRTRDFTGTVTANYQTESITATAGSDFTGVTNTVTWTTGDRADKVINVAVSPAAAAGKQFRVRLTGSTGGITLRGASSVVTLGSGGASLGGLWWQIYTGAGGYDVTALTIYAKFPNQPSTESVVSSAEAPSGPGGDYGQRFIGFITAPQTANYYFWASSYWSAQVYLGTNDTPASKQLVVDQYNGTDGPRVYSYGSASIPLVAGQRYYFEILSKPYGQDQLAVAWTTNSAVQPPNNSEPIPGSVLSYIPGGRFEPYVTTPPASQVGALGGSVTFTVAVGGATPLAYQWRKAGANILAATNVTLLKSSLVSGDATSYDVIITNRYGSVTSAVAVLSIGTGPVITNQPTNLTVGTFQNIGLTVGASGTALNYQWRLNGTALGFQTNSALTVSAANSGEAGSYTVVIANNISSVTSSVALVTIGATPVVTNAPVSVAANPGGLALFTVGATGAAPLNYQWRKDGVNISGMTSTSIGLGSLVSGNAGQYDVVITNVYGSVTSAPAVLSVTATNNVAAGGLWLDFYTGITVTNLLNPAMSELTNSSVYPNSPATRGVISSFETPRNRNIGDYGQHITGYIVPPVTGNYRFMLAADQTAQLFLSTNQLAANKILIAANTSQVDYRNWESENLGAASTNILLVAGQRYYVEVFHVNPDFAPVGVTGYEDNFGVAWQTPTDGASPAIGAAPIPGNYLAYDQRTFAGPSISGQPTNKTVAASSNAIFTVTASGATGYQWRKAGTPISGANGSSLTLISVNNPDAGSYDVLVGSLGGTLTSATAALTVTGGVVTTPVSLTATLSSTNLTLLWPSDHIGWRLIAQTNNPAKGYSANTNDWGTVAGSIATNKVVIHFNLTNRSSFYRLTYP